MIRLAAALALVVLTLGWMGPAAIAQDEDDPGWGEMAPAADDGTGDAEETEVAATPTPQPPAVERFAPTLTTQPTFVPRPPPTTRPTATVQPTSIAVPRANDFELMDVRVTMLLGTTDPPYLPFRIRGSVRNNGRVPGVARLDIQTADGKPDLALEVGSAAMGSGTSIGTENIQPGNTAVFDTTGVLYCADCTFTPAPHQGNDRVWVTIQGVFTR